MLVDLRNYNNVWTESYERETSSVLAAESDLASAVAAAVRARLE
jgi:TolB-like protein